MICYRETCTYVGDDGEMFWALMNTRRSSRSLSLGMVWEACDHTAELIPIPLFTPFSLHSLFLREPDDLYVMPIDENKIRSHIRKQEEMRRQQALERVEHERRVREERHKVWRHRTSIRLLCTSVESLFLFFAQRLANLAGSRRTHNDALRANGTKAVEWPRG